MISSFWRVVSLGTHKALVIFKLSLYFQEKTQVMRMYFSFGVIGLLLLIVIVSVAVVIEAISGNLLSMIFAMQMFFFLSKYF